MRWSVRWKAPAQRDMDRLARNAPRAVPAIAEFIYAPLAENPERVGKALHLALSGHRSARVGQYRVIYRVIATEVEIERVDHRSDVYRPL